MLGRRGWFGDVLITMRMDSAKRRGRSLLDYHSSTTQTGEDSGVVEIAVGGKWNGKNA